MKTLYLFKVIHSPKEMGPSIVDALIQKHGKAKVEEVFAEINQYWQLVEMKIEKAGFLQTEKAAMTYIFIDGWPNTENDEIEKVINNSISKQIPVYVIANKLRINGAQIHGTEDYELLWEEVCYQKALVTGAPRNLSKESRLLKERTATIITRMDEIVPENHLAILFIGALHDLTEALTKLRINFNIIQL